MTDTYYPHALGKSSAPLDHIDTMTSERVSGIPLFLFIAGCVALDWRYSQSDVNIGNIIFLLCCGCIWALALFKRGGLKLRTWRLPDTLFFVYVVFILSSSSWSITPWVTINQAVFVGSMWATTFALGTQPIERLVAYIVHTAFVVAVLSLASAFLFSEAFQKTGELRGVYFHQLRLGLFMAVALGLMCLVVLNGQQAILSRRRNILLLYFIVIAATCIWAYARLYTFFAILALVVAVLLPQRAWPRALFLVALGGLIAWLVLDQGSILNSLGEQGVDLSLTGRTTVWEHSLRLIQQHETLGYGFATFDAGYFDSYWRGNYRPAHPHNSYIQAYFETGFLGLVATLCIVFAHFGVGLASPDKNRPKSYTLFLVLTALLGALTGSVYSGKITAFFALVMLAVSIQTQTNSDSQKAKRLALHGTSPRFTSNVYFGVGIWNSVWLAYQDSAPYSANRPGDFKTLACAASTRCLTAIGCPSKPATNNSTFRPAIRRRLKKATPPSSAPPLEPAA